MTTAASPAPPALRGHTASPSSFVASIDDRLGPAASRFFGDGHRRVTYRFTGIVIDPGPDGAITATAGVLCPPDWSLKAGASQRPHLSTIDALVVGARLAELFLTRRHRLTAAKRSLMWLRRVEIRAGREPDEEDLESLRVEGRPAGTRPHEHLAGTAVTLMTCRIGGMRIRCEVVHPFGRPVVHPVVHPVFDRAGPAATELGGLAAADLAARDRAAGPLPYPAPAGLYGEGFRTRRQPIRDITLQVTGDRQRADGTARLAPVPGTAPGGGGLEGAYQPAVSFIDAFVIALQLGQLLLYDLDGLDRAHSNTLWMRRTVLECDTPERPATGPFPVTAELAGSALLDARDGARWRTADITAACAGVRVLCSVTHELPRPAALSG
ncbi:avirulence D protein (AvrD) [Actinacidiphila rubida]|uniref:Avirulence D protein (AvrD) n=2 Tax=Actinacidiphila rubida TaxID=310780 RepID=A0A1H8KC28_9ACTN|nr:AvrD family protein [Actinacidiphila rubida]SEN90395.1 avirulence D protein (AvrD) [Actinacidiphila rubida]